MEKVNHNEERAHVKRLLREFREYCLVYWDLVPCQGKVAPFFYRDILDKDKWLPILCCLKYHYRYRGPEVTLDALRKNFRYHALEALERRRHEQATAK